MEKKKNFITPEFKVKVFDCRKISYHMQRFNEAEDTLKPRYIRIGKKVEQVSEELYREYHRMARRERYLEEQDMVHGKVLYSQLDNVYVLKKWLGMDN